MQVAEPVHQSEETVGCSRALPSVAMQVNRFITASVFAGVRMLSISTYLKPFFVFRQSEAEHKDIPEELPQSRPPGQAETPVQVVPEQSTHDKAAENVSVLELTFDFGEIDINSFFTLFCCQVLPEHQEEVHGDDDKVSQDDLQALINGQSPRDETAGPSPAPGPDTTTQNMVPGKWVCAQSSHSKSSNFNKHITDKLEVLAKAYTHQGDKWRALSYSKAVNTLKSYHKPVTSYQVKSFTCFWLTSAERIRKIVIIMVLRIL